MDELSPILRKLTEEPLGFLAGFATGLLRMNLMEDPARGWLTSQLRREGDAADYSASSAIGNGNGKGPQTIAID